MKRATVAAVIIAGTSLVLGASLARLRAEPQFLLPTPPLQFEGTQEELVMALIVSETCGACRLLAEQGEMGHMSLALAQRAEAEGRRVRYVGIDLTPGPDGRSDVLEAMGVRFHEVLLGGGWDSTGSLRFLYGEHPGEPAVPQIVILSRTSAIARSGLLLDQSTSVRLRLAGLDEIDRWRSNGMPLAGTR